MAEAEQKKGLEGVVIADTRLSRVQGDIGKLTYCGYDILDLAEHASFSEIVFLLWNVRLPNKVELERFKATLVDEMCLPEDELEGMYRYPVSAHPMAVLRTAVSALGLYDPAAEDNSPDANLRKAMRLTAKMPTIIAAWERIRSGKPVVEPREDMGIAENFIYMLKGHEPNQTEIDALNVYLVLLADHGMNASTFTARVVTSTDGDMYSAITAAIGSLKGPKHGGANEAAMRMFNEIADFGNTKEWFEREVKGKGRRIMGIGHRVYKAMDPRATVLKKHAEALCDYTQNCKLIDVALELEELALADEYFIERKLFPNVDYYSAIVLDAIGIETDMMTPLFAMSRVAGWTAHIIEQWHDNRLIRPRGTYIGPVDQVWTSIDER
ncbi:citrate/2-methylcitrate synthase [Aggregatilinea lenta]|uniref:citrate/2-methylcitrate synthase n=1 Tax=Aggregatilinea lenta TaxID=913108 RepID=UPI000E5A1A06|nr:citrate/2-methylcitrate synthase [Aggregatilinea lenta]